MKHHHMIDKEEILWKGPKPNFCLRHQAAGSVDKQLHQQLCKYYSPCMLCTKTRNSLIYSQEHWQQWLLIFNLSTQDYGVAQELSEEKQNSKLQFVTWGCHEIWWNYIRLKLLLWALPGPCYQVWFIPISIATPVPPLPVPIDFPHFSALCCLSLSHPVMLYTLETAGSGVLLK